MVRRTAKINNSNSKEFPQTLFLKFKSQIKNDKEGEPVKKKIKKTKSTKVFQKKGKFTFFNMNDKEKTQFQKDLYSPLFEQTETFRHIMSSSSLRTVFNSKNDLYQIMRGRSSAKHQVGFATKLFETCVPKTSAKRSKKSEIKSDLN